MSDDVDIWLLTQLTGIGVPVASITRGGWDDFFRVQLVNGQRFSISGKAVFQARCDGLLPESAVRCECCKKLWSDETRLTRCRTEDMREVCMECYRGGSQSPALADSPVPDAYEAFWELIKTRWRGAPPGYSHLGFDAGPPAPAPEDKSIEVCMECYRAEVSPILADRAEQSERNGEAPGPVELETEQGQARRFPGCFCGQTIWDDSFYLCADCMCHPDAATPVLSLDARIREAQRDVDPTSDWSAWAHPSSEGP